MARSKDRSNAVTKRLARDRSCNTVVSKHPKLFVYLNQISQHLKELEVVDVTTIEPMTYSLYMRRIRVE